MLWPSQNPLPQVAQAPAALEQGVPDSGRAAGHPGGAGAVQTSVAYPDVQSHVPSG
jgi:hypothetical protein